jgi:hypothetical protein
MKPVEIVLRGGVKDNDSGGEFTKVHCNHIWKYHNETPLYNKYMLIKCLKKNPPSKSKLSLVMMVHNCIPSYCED